MVLTGTTFAGTPKVPKLAEIQKLLKRPKVDPHLKAYLVDESCFPATLDARAPKGASLEVAAENDIAVRSNLTTTGLGNFKAFSAWARKFGTKRRRILFGLSTMADTVYGYKAWCVVTEPLLVGTQVGFARNDEMAAILWDGELLANIKKQAGHRLAIVFDDVLVVGDVPLEEARLTVEPRFAWKLVAF